VKLAKPQLSIVWLGVAILATALISPRVAYALSFAGQPYVQYGDAQSYSLAVSQLITNCTNPGCPFYIPSGGQIKDLVVVATGSNGQPVNENFPNMDNAYQTPNGTNGESFFRTGGVTVSSNTYPGADPGGLGQFAGDANNTWDTTLGALKGFLGGSDLVFFFNNNQTKSGTALDENLAGWMRITIRDNLGNIIGTYDFTNNNSKYAGAFDGSGGHFLGDVANYTSTGAAPTGAPGGSPTDYVLSGGLICLNQGSAVSCSQTHDQEINNNLGRDEAAYALIFPELNQQLANLFATVDPILLAQYSMNLDVRLGCDPTLFGTDPASAACVSKSLNNGYEQLFFGPLETLSIPTPEPTSLWLFGIGLAGLLGWRKRNDH